MSQSQAPPPTGKCARSVLLWPRRGLGACAAQRRQGTIARLSLCRGTGVASIRGLASSGRYVPCLLQGPDANRCPLWFWCHTDSLCPGLHCAQQTRVLPSHASRQCGAGSATAPTPSASIACGMSVRLAKAWEGGGGAEVVDVAPPDCDGLFRRSLQRSSGEWHELLRGSATPS